MPLRLILFDLDDTLFDHLNSVRCSLSDIRNQFSLLTQHPLDELEKQYSIILEAVHKHVLSGAMTLEESRYLRFRTFFEHFGLHLSPPQINRLIDEYKINYIDNSHPVAGSLELVKCLKRDHVIGIVTNNVFDIQHKKLISCGFKPYVDFMVTSEEIGFAKPHPAIFQAALTQGGCSAEETLFVGDMWETDVVGAYQSKIPVIWLNRRHEPCPQKEMIPAEIHSFQPIENIFAIIKNGE